MYQEAFSRQIDEVAYRSDRQGLLEDIQKGIAQGKLEERREIALNMWNKKLKAVFISKITGLPKTKIDKLKK